MSVLLMLLMLFTPACASDDGSGAPVCHWNAQTQGSHPGGTSFLMVNGAQVDIPAS